MDIKALNALKTIKPADNSPFSRGALKPSEPKHDQLVAQTQKWVGQAFFGTLMKQMRESPFKSDLFSGGRGGEAFGSLYDQQLVDRMSKAAGSKLVNGIVNRIEAKAAYEKNGTKIRPKKKPEGINPIQKLPS